MPSKPNQKHTRWHKDKDYTQSRHDEQQMCVALMLHFQATVSTLRLQRWKKKSSAKQNHMSSTQYCWIKYGAHTLSSVLNQRPLYLPVILLFCLTNTHINRHTHGPQPSVSLILFSRAPQNNKTSKNTNNCRRNHREQCGSCPTRNHWPPWLCNVCDCLVACHAVSHFPLVWMCNSIAN